MDVAGYFQRQLLNDRISDRRVTIEQADRWTAHWGGGPTAWEAYQLGRRNRDRFAPRQMTAADLGLPSNQPPYHWLGRDAEAVA